MDKIPRSDTDDYRNEMVQERKAFIEGKAGKKIEHIDNYSFDPAILPGNVENFTGVAQVPLGFAGPLLVNGEHAKGEFYVPLATTEGTLVASYNRGMKLTRESGGITTTILGDSMQRSPVFIFQNAREARDFSLWLKDNLDEIEKQAETTTKSGKLIEIEQYPAGKFLFYASTTPPAMPRARTWWERRPSLPANG